MNDELTALRSELAELRRRIAVLEGERDEFAQQNAELFVLQQVFSTMNSTLEIDDILATVLRGVHEALGFGRVVLFDVTDSIATRRLETGEDGAVVPSADPRAVRDSVTFGTMVAGASEFAVGVAGDGEGPLEDGEGAFCLVPLVSRETVLGILYADRPAQPEIGEQHVRMLLDFAAQATISMQNAQLYRETKRLLEETRELAGTDPLTGIANRRALGELLDRELHNAHRYGIPLAYLVIDLDDLKAINDARGHRAGDEALRSFATILGSSARRGDIVSRYGGDEFVMVLVHADVLGAQAVLRRLYGTLATSPDLRCSAGVAIFPRHGADAAALFASADRALYEAKQAGKNQFRFAPEPA
jgi:diguanylate cyclase (GGDEF)-like protein